MGDFMMSCRSHLLLIGVAVLAVFTYEAHAGGHGAGTSPASAPQAADTTAAAKVNTNSNAEVSGFAKSIQGLGEEMKKIEHKEDAVKAVATQLNQDLVAAQNAGNQIGGPTLGEAKKAGPLGTPGKHRKRSQHL